MIAATRREVAPKAIILRTHLVPLETVAVRGWSARSSSGGRAMLASTCFGDPGISAWQ